MMKPGDRIGIVGPNGAGKTTLVRTILGELAPDAGEVVVGINTRFAYLDQARAELRDDNTVLEEVADGNDHVELEDGPVHVRTFLRMLLFDDRFADTPVGALSGGERNRVQLAKLLRARRQPARPRRADQRSRPASRSACSRRRWSTFPAAR